MSTIRFRRINDVVSPPGSAGPTRVALNHLSFELISIIMENLGPLRMVSFSKTCRKYRSAYVAHMHSKTKKEISKFAIDPRELMRVLLKTGGIIVGSIPIRILTNGKFEPNNMDIIIPASAEETTKILMDTKFNYQLTGAEVMKGTNNALKRELTFSKGSLIIKIRVATGENALVPLMLSHSTIAMNYVSPWGIFSAYPQLTLLNRSLFNRSINLECGDSLATNYERLIKSFDKYALRGVQFATNASTWYDHTKHKCYKSPLCSHTIRTLYDGGSMFIRFPDIRHQRRYLTAVIRYNEKHTVIWSLGGNYCNDPDLFHRAFATSQKIFPRPFRGEERQICGDACMVIATDTRTMQE
ncbi:hypothetical protein C8R46DRAFT_1220815 [Mycena filopes]|nr:hypothetical protein C8R46DRAFT_1220815 [Mycena filopes]